MNGTHIDIEKINGSIETLSSIESLVNYNNLAINFEEMDEYFKKINFEHANCLYYRDYLDKIYESLEFIKRRINELNEYLRNSGESYAKINDSTKKDLSDISKDLANGVKNSLDGNITTIPKAPEPLEETKPPINTLPIGVAIAATGIAGSVGAVIIDEKYREKEIDQEEVDIDVDEYKEPINEENKEKEIPEIDVIEPYKAVRREREADKYYGNEFHNFMLEDDNDQEEITQEFDDDFFE